MMKTKYSKKMLKLAEKYARAGNTNKEIAKKLGINEDTFYKWIRKHPEFAETIKNAREEVVVPEVEGALYKKAIGHWVEEERVIATVKIDPDQVDPETKKPKARVLFEKREKVKKYIPPDTTAAIFILKNMAPQRWKDRHEFAGEGIKVVVDLGELEKDDKG